VLPLDPGLFPLSLESREVHAKLAALLAPGPSAGVLACLDRVDFADLSLILWPRRVVLIVCRSGRSGLGDRDGLVCGGGIDGAKGNLDVGGECEVSRSRLEFLFLLPITACSEELLGWREGRGGSAGLHNSGYVMAGIVPPPMNPFPRSWSDDSEAKAGLPPDEEDPRCEASSWRDIRRASSRSMRSLHCSSNWRRLSVRALSVSVRTTWSLGILLALWS
jgi:hypothetical protein